MMISGGFERSARIAASRIFVLIKQRTEETGRIWSEALGLKVFNGGAACVVMNSQLHPLQAATMCQLLVVNARII